MITAITPPGITPQTTPSPNLRREQGAFNDALGRAAAAQNPAAAARKAAEEFVATVFVNPILQQLRETNDAAEPFAPTQGEKMFRSMLDQRIASDIVSRGDWPLVQRLTNDLLARGSPSKPTNIAAITNSTTLARSTA